MPAKKKAKAEDKVELPYEIVDGEVAGNAVRKVIDKNGGNELFTVSEDFNDEQIDQVFKLCNRYYSLGGQHGMAQVRNNVQTAMGVTPQEIAGIVKQVLAAEEQKELK